MNTHTNIYVSRKLEKSVNKLISTNQNLDFGTLGKWNATEFLIHRKKCWLITNAKTQYNVLLTNIKSSDSNEIDALFKNAFYSQLIYDGIKIHFKDLCDIIGELHFMSTDNDRRTTGFQNQRVMDFEYWKHEYKTIEEMPINDLSNRINSIPIHLGEGRKMSDFTNSIDEMKQLLIKQP